MGVPVSTRDEHYNVAIALFAANNPKIQNKLASMQVKQNLGNSENALAEQIARDAATASVTSVDTADFPKYIAWSLRNMRWANTIGAGAATFRGQEEKCARVNLGQLEPVLDAISFQWGLVLSACP